MRNTERLVYVNERGESVEFSPKSIYFTNMRDVKGISDIRAAIYTITSMAQDGETETGERLERREVEIPGTINCRSREKSAEYRRTLNRILNPHLSGQLFYEYGDFRRVIDGRVETLPFTKTAI